MEHYLEGAGENESILLAVSYLIFVTHERRFVFEETEDQEQVHAWRDLKKAWTCRFDTLERKR